MSKHQTSIVTLLIQAPWWVSVMLSAIVYFLMVQVDPNIDTANPVMNMMLQSFAIAAPFFACFILLLAPFSFFNARRKAKQLDTQSGIESIRQLHWRNFEELVAEAYRRKGYQVVEGGYGADGGIDLELISKTDHVLVQCKQWKSQKVGVSVVREMFGVLSASKADTVIIICSGYFTQDAINFANDKAIQLINGEALLNLVNEVKKESSISKPKDTSCVKCGAELVERMAKRGPNAGSKFLGCSAFPRCKYTQSID